MFQTKRDWISKEPDDGIGKSYFPLRLQYENGEIVLVNSADEIDHRLFKVLEVRVKQPKMKRNE